MDGSYISGEEDRGGGCIVGLWLRDVVAVLVFAVVSVLVPFFIMRIRREVILTNKKLDQIIQLLSRGYSGGLE
jgi:hypothetical protein